MFSKVSILLDSVLNRVSRIRWLLLPFKKQYLRNMVDEEYKRYSSILKIEESWFLKLSDGLWPYIFFVLPILLVATVTFSSFPSIESTDNILKVAGILAPLCAFMVTVITFSINIKKDSIPGSGPLLTIFTRNQGYLPITAFVMGTLIGIIILANLPQPNKAQEVMALIEALLCIGLLFLLLKHTIEFLGKDDILSLLTDNLIIRHRTALKQEVYYRLMINIFHAEVKNMGFEINPFINKNLNKGLYSIDRPGTIVDINLMDLEKIAKLMAMVDDTTNKKPKLALLPGEEILIDNIPVTALITEEDTHNTLIEKLVRKAFIIGKHAKVDEVNWDEISQMMSNLIQQNDTKNLSAVMDSFNEVVKDYLTIFEQLGIEHSNPDIFYAHYSSYLPPSLYAIGYTKLIDESFQVNSNESTPMLLSFLVLLAHIAWKYKSVKYYDDVLRTLIGSYIISTQYGTQNFDKQEITKSLNTIAILTVRYHLDDEDVSSEHLEAAKPYAITFLKNVLELIRRTIENNDEVMMEKTIAEIDLWSKSLFASDIRTEYQEKLEELAWYREKNSDVETPIIQSKIDRIGLYLELQDYKELVLLVAGGWTLLLIEKDKLDITKGHKTIDRIISYLGGLQNIIEVRLFLGFSDVRSDRPEKALGYDWWDYQEHRNMEVYSMLVAEYWLIDFWIVVALMKITKEDELDIDDLRVQDRFHNLNLSEFVQRIDNYQVSTDIRKALLDGIDVTIAKDKLKKIFIKLRDKEIRNDYLALSCKVISESRIEECKLEFTKGYLSESSLLNLIAQHNATVICNNGSSFVGPEPVTDLVIKQGLVDSWYFKYFWENYGANIGRQHNYRYFEWMEENTNVGDEIETNEDIATRIKLGASKLKAKGYNPTVILIPHKIRVRKVLFDHRDNKELSQKDKDGLPIWICKFDGMDVFTWPGRIDSIAVYDIASFITYETKNHVDKLLDFIIRQPTLEEVISWVEKTGDVAQQELAYCGNQETLRNIKVYFQVIFNFQLGINNADAGIRFKIKNTH